MSYIGYSPWTDAANVGKSLGDSIVEALFRAPMVREQLKTQQEELALRQAQMSNMQSYQQGMLGYHQQQAAAMNKRASAYDTYMQSRSDEDANRVNLLQQKADNDAAKLDLATKNQGLSQMYKRQQMGQDAKYNSQKNISDRLRVQNQQLKDRQTNAGKDPELNAASTAVQFGKTRRSFQKSPMGQMVGSTLSNKLNGVSQPVQPTGVPKLQLDGTNLMDFQHPIYGPGQLDPQTLRFYPNNPLPSTMGDMYDDGSDY